LLLRFCFIYIRQLRLAAKGAGRCNAVKRAPYHDVAQLVYCRVKRLKSNNQSTFDVLKILKLLSAVEPIVPTSCRKYWSDVRKGAGFAK
jgi:hypothetical protein